MNTVEFIGLVSGIVGIVSFVWWLYEKRRPYQNISWRRAEEAAREVSEKMTAQGFSPSLILGIGRGGAIFGSMISGVLGHRPLVVIDRKYEWTEKGRFEDMMFSARIPRDCTRSVLLVAGEAHSGGTMKRYYDYLKRVGAQEIKRAVLFLEEGCPLNIEYYGVKSGKKNIRLPWMFSKQYVRADRSPVGLPPSDKPPFRVKVMFLRHAESTAGEDIFAGASDSDLTVEGVEQAIASGQILCGKKIDAVYSSPLGRALKTAKILNAFVEAEFIVDKRLREIDFGVWDGMARTDVKKKYAPLYSEWEKDPTTTVPRRGENPANVLQRLQDFLDDVANRYRAIDGVEVVAVSHKTAIRIITSFIERGNIAGYRDKVVRNTEMFSVIFDGRRWEIDRGK